jgi:hypothetical protein
MRPPGFEDVVEVAGADDDAAAVVVAPDLLACDEA